MRVVRDRASRGAASRVRRLCTAPTRLAVLARLQEETTALSRKAELEVLEVRRRFLEESASLRARRAAILAGEPLTSEEAALDPLPDVPVQLQTSLDGYWKAVLTHVLTSLEAARVMGPWLTERDDAILSHLVDVQIACQPHSEDANFDTVRLTLVFKPNEHLMVRLWAHPRRTPLAPLSAREVDRLVLSSPYTALLSCSSYA